MIRILVLISGVLLASLLGMSLTVHARAERSRAGVVVAQQFTPSIASNELGTTHGKVLRGDQSGLAHHHGETHGDHVNLQDDTTPFQVPNEQGPPITGYPWFAAGVTTAPWLRPPNV